MGNIKMKAAIAMSLLCLCLCSINKDKPIITEEAVQEIKAKATFEVYNYEDHPFKDWSKKNIKQLLGLRLSSLKTGVDKLTPDASSDKNLPEFFDSREKWPKCVHAIRNQGSCGSCWALASSEVLSDRFCISSGGETNVVLSIQNLVSCDWFDHGCMGGQLGTSWFFLKWKGIVTDECKPYSSGNGNVEWCTWFSSTCNNPKIPFKKYYAKNYYFLSSIEAIKENILKYGPVETGFTTYADFVHYKSGIYKRTTDQIHGGHAVKVLGWGKENGTDYWIVANSWGPEWGENGFFRIAFGECDFDSNMIAGDPYFA